MDLLQQLMMEVQGTPSTESAQGMYTDIMTGQSYHTLEEFLAGRQASDHRRMGNVQGGSGLSTAFGTGFSGGFA